jgi:hypothetical protein
MVDSRMVGFERIEVFSSGVLKATSEIKMKSPDDSKLFIVMTDFSLRKNQT